MSGPQSTWRIVRSTNLEKHNLPTTLSVRWGSVCEADIGGWEATSDYRNPDQEESEEACGVEAEVCETFLSFL